MEKEKDEEDLNLISVDSNEIIEEENNENEINNQKNSDNNIDDENEELIKENKRKLGIKKDLIEVLQEVTNYLNKDENIPKSISEIYDIFIDNDFITKSHLKDKVNDCLLKFMFFVVGPAFGIIYLIGIFQIKALMNALLELIKKSFFDFLKCRFREKCEITISENEDNVYDFYNYFYNYSTNENIDFNLMMITGAIGNILIKWIGFKGSSGVLCIFTFLSILWIINFDFNFKDKDEKIFDYNLLKILNILFIYLLLLIGIGGSSLLSHQILIESHLKYKNYLINKLRNDLNNNEKMEVEKMEEMPDLNLGLIINNTVNARSIGSKKSLIQSEDINIDKDANMKRYNTFNPKEITDEKRQKILEERLNKKEKNKFDFFFMICITTIFGYLGRYGMNCLLKNILENYIFGNENFDKRVFMFCIMGLYAVSLIFSIIVYQIYKWSIFEYDRKNENKNKKTIKISQICGYIIYTETKNPKNPAKKNCCRLCCESQQNCCNETFCNLISIFGCSDDNPDCYCSCMCKQCKYNLDDYGKNKEVFRYCYKAERKCLWCNKFMTNDTQKRIFPFMIEYFILQLTTIGFEKHYEKYKNQNDIINSYTWILVFIGTFIFFSILHFLLQKYLVTKMKMTKPKIKMKKKKKPKIKKKTKLKRRRKKII